MATINVLIIVDVENALSGGPTGGISNNVYMCDTNRFMGSGSEGGDELQTACSSTNLGGDTIVWSIVSINPGDQIVITGFTGQMVTNNLLIPAKNTNGSWSGALVPNLGQSVQVQYSVTLQANGTTLNFDPFLNVNFPS